MRVSLGPRPLAVLFAFGISVAALTVDGADDAPDFVRDVAPILTAKCGGCHGDLETEGDLSLATYDELMKGGKHGLPVTPGESASSRLYLMSSGKLEPAMPPEGEEPLTTAEIETLAKWIDAGAKGPSGATTRPMPVFPQVAPSQGVRPITSLAWSPDGSTIAVARDRSVRFYAVDADGATRETSRVDGLAGKVNRVTFSADGRTLVAAGGLAGAFGEAALIDVADPTSVIKLDGHVDALYDAVLSPDGTILATAGYDRTILLRDAKSGETLRTLAGHNGAVFDLAFSADGKTLVSASADETAKVWNVATGERLDTLNQCEAEQWACDFDPTSHRIYAAGADHRVRAWDRVSVDQAKINPIVFSRFAHEGTVTHLALATSTPFLATAADDGSVKVWRTADLTIAWIAPPNSSVVSGLAFDPAGAKLAVARLDGTWEILSVPALDPSPSAPRGAADASSVAASMPGAEPPAAAEESEPNDDPAATAVRDAPLRATGIFGAPGDADCYRFRAEPGQRWIVETNAAKAGSPADTFVEILSPEGAPVLRTRLQAVRDSYFTFRGKDSSVSDDFRVHNWQEMELNDLLYANGEVVQLWLYPRGPDSGFKVYPGFGNRRTYFDTPALAHALGEPCWIVRPVAAGNEPIANGLPVFDVFHENDDDGERKLGKDSRLSFAPTESGEYVVRVSDVRGEGSPSHKYELVIRPARPAFSVSAKVTKADAVPAGGGREIEFTADRVDGFEGPIEIVVEALPAGWSVSAPTIEAGQLKALGALYATPDAKTPTEEEWKQVKAIARANVDGQERTRDVAGLALPKLAGAPQVGIAISRANAEEAAEAPREPLVVTLRPGQTVELRVAVDRKEVKSRISFGNEDSGRNLPHGVFVDNVGLSGLLIVEDKSERTFFVTAAPIAVPQTRLFHLRADTDGGLVSPPVTLEIVP